MGIENSDIYHIQKTANHMIGCMSREERLLFLEACCRETGLEYVLRDLIIIVGGYYERCLDEDAAGYERIMGMIMAAVDEADLIAIDKRN